MQIREPKRSDLRPLAQSFVAVEAEGFLESDPDATVELAEREFGSGLTCRRREFLVASDDRGPLGALIGCLGPRPGFRSFGMWLVLGARGQGIGRRLLAEQLATRPGCRFEIEVWPENERAIRLYERFAFRRVGLSAERRRRYGGSSSHTLVMVRDGSPGVPAALGRPDPRRLTPDEVWAATLRWPDLRDSSRPSSRR